MRLKLIWPVFLLLFTILRKSALSEMVLPIIQINHDSLGDDYPEMQEEVHLEDFFWTGSGDGPPDYLKKVHTGISKGKEVIVKTETVVATVYVDGNNEVDIPICVDCFPGDLGGGNWAGFGGVGGVGSGALPLNYSATDRRYWLLTVMSGFYAQKDNPMLEEKLARLYRLAFTRQQSKHLGINGAQQISGIAVENAKRRREHIASDISDDALGTTTAKISTATTQDLASEVEILNLATDIINHPRVVEDGSPINTKSELATSSEENDPNPNSTSTAPATESGLKPEATDFTEESPTGETIYETIRPWEFLQEDGKSEKHTMAAIYEAKYQQPAFTQQRVRVIIHNVSLITEVDMQNGLVTSGYDEDVNEKIDDRPIANQTELIYTVFVNGRPVLASTAAFDMKLVSESEVAEVMGKETFMKAEPYLREPQATPLAPATRSSRAGFLDSIQNNPALVIVTSLAILLLLLLLIALLLMGRSRKREKMTEVKRTSSRNELLSENQSTRPTSTGTMLETGRSTVQSRDIGIQNFSFEHEQSGHSGQRGSSRVAHINFPGPPNSSSRRGSITSSDNTSDSSVYCPLNPPTADVQRILDEKAARLFEKHQRRHSNDQHHQYDRAEGHGREEAVYTTVLTEKKREKGRYKNKRRYLSENRVGSLETSPTQRQHVHSSGEEAVTDSNDTDGLRPNYQNLAPAETFNPHNNYHRNKLLHQKTIFRDDRSFTGGHSTEAVNHEIIRALQPSEKSSDTGSIGSFLSMASVKTFPKSALPEPLNRVLEPVFVTYYDNADADNMPPAVHQAAAKFGKSSRKQRPKIDPLDATTNAKIEGFPTPKAPPLSKSLRKTSQSDNPDPGVVGPVVWERHKKGLSDDLENDELRIISMNSNFSPVRDPAAMRNHYEGLLEGAIQMYSSQDDLPMPLPSRDFTNSRKPTKREYRGSSAGLSSFSSRVYNTETRPATAQPEKTARSNHSTQPPSPTFDAWGGSIHGSHSPLVRPMSAGPFHRPEPLHARSATSSGRSDISAAPIIEAIQQELRKFKQDDV